MQLKDLPKDLRKEVQQALCNPSPGHVTIFINPIGKPRMTQKDKWAKRPCVLRYHQFRDVIRRHVKLGDDVVNLSWTAYLPIPKSWSQKKKDKLRGQYHRQKPDRDNIDKALLDSLFAEDSGVASGKLIKRWDDGNGARIELEWS